MKFVLLGSLNSKLIFMFIAVSVASLGAVSVISYFSSTDTLTTKMVAQMTSLAHDKAVALNQLYFMKITELEGTMMLTNEENTVEGSNAGKEVTAAQIKTADEDTAQLDPLTGGGEKGFHNAMILNKFGVVVWANDKSLIGNDMSTDPVFIGGMKNGANQYSIHDGKKIMRTGAPLFSATATELTNPIGVTIAETNTDGPDAILNDYSGLESTMETFIVGSDHTLLSESRYKQGMAFNQKIDSAPVTECFENGKDLSITKYTNYRGQTVYGTSVCQKELGYVVITELDAAGVLAPAEALANLYLTIGASIVGGVGAFAYFMSRSISRPIKSAALVAQKIASGDLGVSVSGSKSKDEVGVLLNSEKQMVENLKSTLSEIQNASQSVYANAQQLSSSGSELNSSVQQIATTVDQISRGSQTQAQRVEKSKHTVEELTKSMNELSSSAKESAEISNQVGTLSERGAEAAGEANERMNKIIEVTNQSAQKVHQLADKTSEITTALQVIREIADQTNLLALNAAIEAARAGETGRGFAVVADEVRRLAESSARSSDDIDVKLKQIHEYAQEVVQEIETSSNEVNQGKLVIDSSLKTLHEIAKNIKNVSENVKNLAGFAHEQAVKVESISADAVDIAAVSEENAASTEEASAAVEQQTAQTNEIATASTQLAELASQLQSTLGKFTLEGTKQESHAAEKKSILAKIGLAK